MHENQIPFVHAHRNVTRALLQREYGDAAIWVEKIEEFLGDALKTFPEETSHQIKGQIRVLRTFRQKLERPSLLMLLMFGNRKVLDEFRQIMERMALDVFVPYLANHNVDLLRWTLGGPGGEA